MGKHLPKMRPYRTRRSKKEMAQTKKHTLSELHERVGSEVRSLILSLEQNELLQAQNLQQKLKSDLSKHRFEMVHIASPLGDNIAKAVREFLDSVDAVLQTRPEFIDPAVLHRCHTTTENLKQVIQAA